MFYRLLLCLACASAVSSAGCARISEMSGADERAVNLRNLARLEVGMTKTDVVRVMGEPLKDEKYHRPDVWFYYTDWDWADGVKTSSECTPVVFEDGKLVGWGHRFYKQYRQKDWR